MNICLKLKKVKSYRMLSTSYRESQNLTKWNWAKNLLNISQVKKTIRPTLTSGGKMIATTLFQPTSSMPSM